MGGHFDAVGFGDPRLGFEATREHLRAAVAERARVVEASEFVYYDLETESGCGLAAATDGAGFLLNGCPYFRAGQLQPVRIDALVPWDEAEPYQGGAFGSLLDPTGRPVLPIAFALPHFAATLESGWRGEQAVGLVGLGYRATSHGSDRRLPQDGRRTSFLRPVGLEQGLSPFRRCNVECRGRIESATILTNERTGARLAYALLDCEVSPLEVVLDLPSLSGGLAEGAYLEGSFWLVSSSSSGSGRR